MDKQKYLEPEITFLFTDDELSMITPALSNEFDDSDWSDLV